jgi:hypothetical protein
MKAVFEMEGRDETKIKIRVEIDSSRYVLTVSEQKRLKVKLQNQVHQLLREQGFDVCNIVMVRPK